GYVPAFHAGNRRNAGREVPSRHTPWPPRMPTIVPSRSGARSDLSASRLPAGHRCTGASAGLDKGKLGVSRGRKATGLVRGTHQLAGLPEVRSDVVLEWPRMGGRVTARRRGEAGGSRQ